MHFKRCCYSQNRLNVILAFSLGSYRERARLAKLYILRAILAFPVPLSDFPPGDRAPTTSCAFPLPRDSIEVGTWLQERYRHRARLVSMMSSSSLESVARTMNSRATSARTTRPSRSRRGCGVVVETEEEREKSLDVEDIFDGSESKGEALRKLDASTTGSRSGP
jgi:hypothetical protein